MANYSDLSAGDPILASDLNALSDDVINASTGHQHSGSEDGHATIKPDAIGDGASITWDGRILLDKGGDLASGSAITPGTNGNYFDITGTTTITSIASLQAGTIVVFQFDGILIITHNSTSLILDGAVNHTTAAGHVFGFISEGSGNWREIFRIPAPSGAISRLNNATANELVSVGATITELDAEANLTFDGTTLTLGQGQVGFPATQVASAGANVLDDYEEGTWTPTVQDNSRSNSESQAYDTQLGFYTKIGNLVYFSFTIDLSSLGSLTTSEVANIAGLPFTSNSAASTEGNIYIGQATGLSIGAGQVVTGHIPNNDTVIGLRTWDATTGTTTLLLSELTANGAFIIAGLYRV